MERHQRHQLLRVSSTFPQFNPRPLLTSQSLHLRRNETPRQHHLPPRNRGSRHRRIRLHDPRSPVGRPDRAQKDPNGGGDRHGRVPFHRGGDHRRVPEGVPNASRGGVDGDCVRVDLRDQFCLFLGYVIV